MNTNRQQQHRENFIRSRGISQGSQRQIPDIRAALSDSLSVRLIFNDVYLKDEFRKTFLKQFFEQIKIKLNKQHFKKLTSSCSLYIFVKKQQSEKRRKIFIFDSYFITVKMYNRTLFILKLNLLLGPSYPPQLIRRWITWPLKYQQNQYTELIKDQK